MSLLWRYVLSGLLPRLALSLLALCGLYLVFDLGDQGRRAAAQLGWAVVLEATLLRLPLIAVQVLPAALLAAAALWIVGLRRGGELEALRAAGLRPRQLAMPLLAVGLVAGVSSFSVLELLVPRSEQAADVLLGAHRSPLTGLGQAGAWLRQGRWLLERQTDGSVLALELDARGRALRRVRGRVAASGDALVGARVIALGERMGRRREVARLPLPGLREALALWRAPRAEALSWRELAALVSARARAGQGRPAEVLVLHAKLIYPLVNVVLALFAVGLLIGTRRRGSGAELWRAAGALLATWALLAASWSLARAGLLSAAAASWGALFAAITCAAAFALRRGSKG
ncbi:MAG: LptF/LptG family permease [Myxococcales bacterium]|nr:LptF/LptG family permease [Myxococcales bacterium]